MTYIDIQPILDARQSGSGLADAFVQPAAAGASRSRCLSLVEVSFS